MEKRGKKRVLERDNRILRLFSKQVGLGRRNTNKTFYKLDAWRDWKRSKDNIPVQFIVQPSKYVQRIKAIRLDGGGARLKFEKGRSIFDITQSHDKKWLFENRKEIAKQLADALIDVNLRFGSCMGTFGRKM